MKRIFYIVLVSILLSSCGVSTSYLGKSYPQTKDVEIFFTFKDISPAYEIMGYMDAAPIGLSGIEDAQKKVEQVAREKGADAIVFDGVMSESVNPTVQTTEEHTKNAQGGYTTTSTSVQSSTRIVTVKAIFIKYK